MFLFSHSIQMVYVRLCMSINFILYLPRLVFLPEIFIFYSVQSRAAFSFGKCLVYNNCILFMSFALLVQDSFPHKVGRVTEF